MQKIPVEEAAAKLHQLLFPVPWLAAIGTDKVDKIYLYLVEPCEEAHNYSSYGGYDIIVEVIGKIIPLRG